MEAAHHLVSARVSYRNRLGAYRASDRRKGQNVLDQRSYSPGGYALGYGARHLLARLSARLSRTSRGECQAGTGPGRLFEISLRHPPEDDGVPGAAMARARPIAD